jgi:hypothetical protein
MNNGLAKFAQGFLPKDNVRYSSLTWYVRAGMKNGNRRCSCG